MVEPSTGSLRYLLALHDVLYLVPPVGVDPLAPECRDNSECPAHAACINRQCLNPCAVTDPCAVNAFCRVQNHEPVCTCPAGYLGDPRVSCTKRKFILVLIVPLICKDMVWKNWSWMRTYQHIQNHLALNQLTSSSVRVWYNSTTADAGRKEPVSMCTSRHLATYPIRSTACVAWKFGHHQDHAQHNLRHMHSFGKYGKRSTLHYSASHYVCKLVGHPNMFISYWSYYIFFQDF